MNRHATASKHTAELDYGLRSAFIETLDDDQKLRIFDLTARGARELQRWAARYPLIRRVRVWPLSLSVAAATSFVSASALVTIARMSLWVFTIDDLFDEEMVPIGELRRRVTRYNDLLAGDRVDPKRERDSLALALQDIRDDLKRYPLFEPLQHEWAAAVSGTLNAMMREHDWRSFYKHNPGDLRIPSYDEYVQNGLYSIGGPPHIWTALIAINDASILQSVDHAKDMERTTSICIRLANDLQSHVKEVAEGKINSVVIRQREAIVRGCTEPAALELARETVRQDIRRGLGRCRVLYQQARTATHHPERAMLDIAQFVCDFYVHHDYHTFMTGAPRSS